MMKIGFSLLLALFVACSEEPLERYASDVTIRLMLSDSLAVSPEGILVRLQNLQNNLSYSAAADAEGYVRMRVEHGFYSATAQSSYRDLNTLYHLNGAIASFLVAGKEGFSGDMHFAYAKGSQLLFSEIYYTGCIAQDGKNYLKDQYLKIYNNSDQVVYLDGVCIGFIDPMNALTTPSAWVGFDYLPIFNFAWGFPGSGEEHPLQPGREVVVALNAINHLALGQSNSVDLSNPTYWATYSVASNLIQQSPPAPGVSLMHNFWKYGSATSAAASSISPGWIMWRVQGMTMEQFLNSAVKNHPSPTITKTYLGVPIAWVYDGVECFRDAGSYKRLPATIDNGFAHISEGIASGFSVHRRVDEALSVPGRVVYRDTNNSTEDFVKGEPSLRSSFRIGGENGVIR